MVFEIVQNTNGIDFPPETLAWAGTKRDYLT